MNQPQPESIAFECAKCGALPVFSRRASWGFNMADAYCPTVTCGGVSFRPRESK